MPFKIIATGRHPRAKPSLRSCFMECDVTTKYGNVSFAEQKLSAAAGKPATVLQSQVDLRSCCLCVCMLVCLCLGSKHMSRCRSNHVLLSLCGPLSSCRSARIFSAHASASFSEGQSTHILRSLGNSVAEAKGSHGRPHSW